jgi:hypothetical protein
MTRRQWGPVSFATSLFPTLPDRISPQPKVASAKVVAKALSGVPEKEIGAVIGGLDGEEQALLMKYIYRSVTCNLLIHGVGGEWVKEVRIARREVGIR